MKDKQRYKSVGYYITTDTHLQDEEFGITTALHSQLEVIIKECQDKKNKKIIGKLTELILQYPKTPQLKNYLSVAYNTQGNYKKAIEVNYRLVREHPDYLFGKINLANEYLHDNQPEKVPEILGNELELKSLYPERDVFHLSEVTTFYKTVIEYFLAVGEVENAEDRLEILYDVAPDEGITQKAEMSIIAYRMKEGQERMKREAEERIEVRVIKNVPSTGVTTSPEFHHAEITSLYKNGLNIPHENLDAILALPRETVILDLENVLKDAIHRYYYFQKFEYAEEVCSFPLHAMLLLAELQSEKSLPLIVDFLSYEKEFIDFWLCDHITETLWLPIYKLGNNNLEILERFLLQPGIDTYGKLAVSMALQQMVLHQPEKRNVIADLYERVFSYFNKASFEDNLIDSDFLGLAIGDTIDCGITELLPVIKSLHEKGYVSEGINGTYEDVVKLFKRPLAEYKYKEILSIQNLYTHILSTWWGYKEENIAKTEFEDIEDAIFEDAEEEGTLWKREKKHTVGRNEPCPCGSGKKYKKCCIDKH